MTSLGLISDVHAAAAPLDEALTIFRREAVDQIYCLGDIAGYNDELEATISLLQASDCNSIIGNHDISYIMKTNAEKGDDPDLDISASYLQQLPSIIDTIIEGKSIYMVHAEPPEACHGGIKLRDKTGEIMDDRVEMWAKKLANFDYDILIVGHTHQVYNEKLGETLVINPGSTVFNHCCMILHLPEMRVETYPLSGKSVERTWNWGEHVIYANRRKTDGR
jgi:putative phosphoesterase